MAVFNAYEVFEIAQQIERNGYAFYTKAASMIDDPEAKAFMENMASLEVSHEDTFGQLKEKFKLNADQEVPDLENQTLAYLKAVASGNVFVASNTQQDLIKGGESIAELIRLALSFEKDSIVYFATVKKMMADTDDKEKIEALIQEEISHVAYLVEELDKHL